MRYFSGAIFLVAVVVLITMLHYGCDLLNSESEDAFGDEFSLIDTQPAWSPDGRTIAYAHAPQDSAERSLGSSPYQIWLIDVDGTNKRFVAPGNSVDWSPDSKKLVISDGRILIFDLETKEFTTVERYYKSVQPAWSPDGSTIAYTNSICSGDTCGIWFSSLDGMNKHYVIKYGLMPNWSSSGERLYYVLRSQEIWSYELVSGNSELVLNWPAFSIRYPAISSDGSRLLWTNTKEEDFPQIWVMDLESGGKEQLTSKGGEAPCWSPNGSQIAYAKFEPDGHIWIMNADGSAKRQLTF
jgi:Tol biopolymer transport system component